MVTLQLLRRKGKLSVILLDVFAIADNILDEVVVTSNCMNNALRDDLNLIYSDKGINVNKINFSQH